MKTFGVLDYIVLCLVLIITLLIGLHQALKKYYIQVFKKCFKKSAKVSQVDAQDDIINKNPQNSEISEYLIASASMSPFPITLSLLATFFSATALLGNPAEVYQYGIQYWICTFGLILTPLIGGFATGPFFARLKVTSVFEYLKFRYDSEFIRLLAVICYLVRSMISSALFIYGPATTLNLLASITPNFAITIIGVVGTFYTTIGGIRAVIWTDAFQLIIMFAGLILVISKGLIDLGGINELLRINREGGRLELFIFDPNPLMRQNFWSLVVGMIIYFSMSYCLDQQMVQRFSSAKNARSAQIALFLNAPGVFLLMSTTCFCGFIVYATYAKCDPLSIPSTGVSNSNQILPYYVIDKLNSINGAAGIFLSSILASALSSVSSALNSSAAILWGDFLKRFEYFKIMNDRKSAITTKLLVLICGVIAIALAFLVSTIGGNLVQMNFALNGAFNAPIIGVFILGSMMPFTNRYGALCGIISGFSMGLWLSIGPYLNKPIYKKLSFSIECLNSSNITSSFNTTAINTQSPLYSEASNLTGFNKFYSLSYMWYTTLGVFTTIFIGTIVSLATGCNKTNKHDLYLFNWALKLKNIIKMKSNETNKIELVNFDVSSKK